jgi:hypothetical protein
MSSFDSDFSYLGLMLAEYADERMKRLNLGFYTHHSKLLTRYSKRYIRHVMTLSSNQSTWRFAPQRSTRIRTGPLHHAV